MTNQTAVSIACKGSRLMDIADMRPFQGELKSLSVDDYVKLRANILDNGFSFPIAIWTHKSQSFLLDGHQRHRVLSKMREEGAEVPPVPIVDVDAESYEQAKRKLLSAVAQFGRVEGQGLYEFLGESGISFEEMAETMRIPDLNMDFFKAEFFDVPPPPEDEQKSGGKELGQDDFSKFEHTCPRCNFEWNDSAGDK